MSWLRGLITLETNRDGCSRDEGVLLWKYEFLNSFQAAISASFAPQAVLFLRRFALWSFCRPWWAVKVVQFQTQRRLSGWWLKLLVSPFCLNTGSRTEMTGWPRIGTVLEANNAGEPLVKIDRGFEAKRLQNLEFKETKSCWRRSLVAAGI